jgi:hypothetical protein
MEDEHSKSQTVKELVLEKNKLEMTLIYRPSVEK